MMERYLSVIHAAVLENELDVVPFKMFLDRFYGLRYRYQINGSQQGFEFEIVDEEKRKEIEPKYRIEYISASSISSFQMPQRIPSNFQ